MELEAVEAKAVEAKAVEAKAIHSASCGVRPLAGWSTNQPVAGVEMGEVAGRRPASQGSGLRWARWLVGRPTNQGSGLRLANSGKWEFGSVLVALMVVLVE